MWSAGRGWGVVGGGGGFLHVQCATTTQGRFSGSERGDRGAGPAEPRRVQVWVSARCLRSL